MAVARLVFMSVLNYLSFWFFYFEEPLNILSLLLEILLFSCSLYESLHLTPMVP